MDTSWTPNSRGKAVQMVMNMVERHLVKHGVSIDLLCTTWYRATDSDELCRRVFKNSGVTHVCGAMSHSLCSCIHQKFGNIRPYINQASHLMTRMMPSSAMAGCGCI